MYKSRNDALRRGVNQPVDASDQIAVRAVAYRGLGAGHGGKVHPTAFVERGAKLAEGVVVGPFCYVGADAAIGRGTRLVGHVSVLGRTTIGAGNTIWPHATIGAEPQDLKYDGEPTRVVIGDNNAIRESVTIHLGTDNGGGVTQVGSDNLLMVGAHVAHDCQIGNHVILGNAVQLAGHVQVQDHAVISGAAGVHHYVTVGQYAFIGGLTRVVNDVPPFLIVEGNPSKVRGVNTVGLARHRFSEETIGRLKDAYRRLFRGAGDAQGPATTMSENLRLLNAEYPDDECIRLLIASIRSASIGLFGRSREGKRTDNRRRNPVK